MTRFRLPLAAALALAVALAPGLALARVGGGASMGSRGGFTFSAPPSTSTAPYSAAPMQRSFTPRHACAFLRHTGPRPSAAVTAAGMAGAAPSARGWLGGLVGAGIGGMLFGHGMFGGIDGGGSIIGLLIQLALIFFIGRWVLRLVMGRQAMFAGFGGSGGGFGGGGRASARGPAPASARAAPSITIAPADYQAFEQLLKAMQAAWSQEGPQRPARDRDAGDGQLLQRPALGPAQPRLAQPGGRRAAGQGRPGAGLARRLPRVCHGGDALSRCWT